MDALFEKKRVISLSRSISCQITTFWINLYNNYIVDMFNIVYFPENILTDVKLHDKSSMMRSMPSGFQSENIKPEINAKPKVSKQHTCLSRPFPLWGG